MSQNLISFQLSATDVTAIDGALKTLEEKLVGLIALSTQQRSKLVKMGKKSEAFCREAVELLSNNPAVLPANFSLQEMRRDLTGFDTLRPRVARLDKLLERMRDSQLAMGSDLMSAALEGYTYLKVAGKGEGLEGARRTLSARFSRGPRTSKSEAGQIAVPKFGDIRWPSTRRNSAVLASCSYAFPDEGVFLDLLSAEKRSWLMSRIKSKDTTPELAVRRLLHRLGYRYRLHTAHLPGKPDLVFPARKKVVFVHGCFWHGHAGCRYAKTPGSRSEFWREKMDRNRSRDQRNQKELEDLGWSVFVVWQCQLRQPANVLEELKSFLGPPGPQPRRRRSSRDSPTLR